MKTWMLVVLAAAVGTGSRAAVPAATNAASDLVRSQFRQFERDIPSLYLINGLNLSQEQSGKLAGILERAQAAETKSDEKIRRVLDRNTRDLDKEIVEIVEQASKRRDLAAPKPAKTLRGQRLASARQELGKLKGERSKELDALADEAYGMLSASQRKIVGNFVPCFIPPQDFRNPERVGQAAADTSFVEKALAKLRQAPAEQSSRAVDVTLDILVPYAMKERRIRYSEEAEESVRDELAASLQAVLPKIREMTDADFELEKAKIAGQVLPIDKDLDTPGVLRWKTRQYILNTGILDVLQARASSAAPAAAARSQSAPVGKDAHEAGNSVRTAIVLTGLDLTPDQATKMLGVVRGALDARKKVEDEIQGNMSEALSPYTKLRAELASGQPTSKGENAAMRFHGGVKELYEQKMVKELLKYEAEMDQILTANQVAFLSGTPDAVPPAAPGAAPGGGFRRLAVVDKRMDRAAWVLSEARRLSALEFAKQKDSLCRSFVNECVKEDGLTAKDVDIETETARAAEVLEKARKLTQTDYAAQRSELAADLLPRRATARPATYGAHYVRGAPVQELSQSTRLLFSETACRVLENMVAKAGK